MRTQYQPVIKKNSLQRDGNEVCHICNQMAFLGLLLVLEGRKEGFFYLTTHSTHFIYGYMASDI